MHRRIKHRRADRRDHTGDPAVALACVATTNVRNGSRQYDSSQKDEKTNDCCVVTSRHGSEQSDLPITVRQGGLTKACNVLAKEWDPIFSKSRPPTVSESYVERKRSMRPKGRSIDLFLRDAEDSSALYYFDEVKELCHSVCSTALKSGRGEAGNKRAAWLDCRNSPNSNDGQTARKYQNPLTATSLRRHLLSDLYCMRRILM